MGYFETCNPIVLLLQLIEYAAFFFLIGYWEI